jgi:hypothetical protein
MTEDERRVLVDVLVYHARVDGPPPYSFHCACGWGMRPEHLGQSFAEHVADVYAESIDA